MWPAFSLQWLGRTASGSPSDSGFPLCRNGLLFPLAVMAMLSERKLQGSDVLETHELHATVSGPRQSVGLSVSLWSPSAWFIGLQFHEGVTFFFCHLSNQPRAWEDTWKLLWPCSQRVRMVSEDHR